MSDISVFLFNKLFFPSVPVDMNEIFASVFNRTLFPQDALGMNKDLVVIKFGK